MSEDRVALLSSWRFGTPEGDVHELVQVKTGRVLQREVWPAGKAPVVVMPGFRQPGAGDVAGSIRWVSPADAERLATPNIQP